METATRKTKRRRKRRPLPSLRIEESCWAEGAVNVIGVDEVGVGPMAGPVAAGAVLLVPGQRFPWFRQVRDSKLLSEAEREKVTPKIQATVPWAVGWASAEEIDRIGILPARRLCSMRAIEQLGVAPDAVISDALDLPLDCVRAVVRADSKSVAVAAASIISKVARDHLMEELCAEHPGYGFCRHKGYPTPDHKRWLRLRGPSPVHRRSWAPVAQLPMKL